MAYDSKRRTVLLFGGFTSASQPTNRTWTWTGSGWSEHLATGDWPAARYFHAMAYDAARDQVVLFGGFNGSTDLGDTWVWNGKTWTRKMPLTSPSARRGATMGYDSKYQAVVLFSGQANNTAQRDTWIWDGTNWKEVTPTNDDSPPPRTLATLTWNPAREALVVTQTFNFAITFMDTWEWVMTSSSSGFWRELAPSVRPTYRALAGAYTTLDGSGITIGFGADTSGAARTDQWELRFDVPSAVDSCRTSFDVDGDELVGCGSSTDAGDPDCWRVCTPLCPPGTSCPMDAPRCGDNLCSAIENCRNCPLDCTTCTDTSCGDFACDPGETCLGDCP
jgi:hypothetical protein